MTTSGVSGWSPAFASNAEEFIRKRPDNANPFIRTTRSDGKTKEAIFDLGNLSVHKKQNSTTVRLGSCTE